jgi:hypothetical protein
MLQNSSLHVKGGVPANRQTAARSAILYAIHASPTAMLKFLTAADYRSHGGS